MNPVKRIVLWALSTLSGLVLLFGYHTSTSAVLATSGSESAFTGTLQAGAATTPNATTPNTTTTPTTGTVTGDVARTRWGPVQVQLDVKGTTITHVSVLQYPNENGRDVEISNYALPKLIQETLDEQGSNISMVSGATYTSQGYLQSLQSALDQAGA